MNKRTKDFVLIILGVVAAFFLINLVFGSWGQALVTAGVFVIGYIVGKNNPDL
tara:strand:+ start:70 stop:228 length:159 start_codon:yes stop_codon:yes gene_type:complete